MKYGKLEKFERKNTRGITLIALVLTIVVLLILAGIAINAIFGNKGLIEKAQWSKFVTEYRQVEEVERMYEYTQKLYSIGGNTAEGVAISKKIATTEETEVAIPINKYAITEEEVSVNAQLSEYIENLEGDINPQLYVIDKTKLKINDHKDKYALNINSGKVYDITSVVYGGLTYYTPEMGIDKKNQVVINEEEIGQLNIHYLPGYEGETEIVESLDGKSSVEVAGSDKFTRNSYQFVGWKNVTSTIEEDEVTEQEKEELELEGGTFTEKEETEIYYGGEEIPVETTDIYLEAIWTQNSVILNANEGTVNGAATYTYAVVQGEEYGELPNAERDGYIFGGWYTDNGTFNNQIVDEDIYNTNVTTLFAYWVERTTANLQSKILKITFNPNGGEWRYQRDKDKPEISKEIVKGKKIGSLVGGSRLTKINENGTYNFDCWTLSDKETKVKSSYIPTENVTLYARYTIHMYYDYQGGTGTKEYKNVKIGGIRGYVYNSAKKEGYKNENWYTRRNGDGDKVTYSYRINQTRDFTIYAHWLKKCTIRYNLNCEDTDLTAPKDKYVYQTAKIGTLANPKRPNYTFLGWYTTSGLTTKVEGSYIVQNDMVLYAKWERTKLKITFKSNGGVGTMNEQQLEKDVETPLNKNTFTKDYYNFAGWKDSNGNIYEDESNITITANLTLTAQWQPWTHTIKFDLNGGSGSYADITKTYGTDVTLPAPTRTGYTFKNWSTTSSGTGGTNYDNSEGAYKTDQNGGEVTLYAIWTIEPPKLTEYYTYGGAYFSSCSLSNTRFKCSAFKPKTGSFEKLNIKISNLQPNKRYKMNFSMYNNFEFNTKYKNGCKLSNSQVTGTGSSISDLTWQNKTSGKWIYGEFTFTPSYNYIYWVWDLSGAKDGTEFSFTIDMDSISLVE